MVVFVSSNAAAEYRIAPGDVLGLSVAGIPELNTKVTVDTDGNATLPLAGPLLVAGMSVTKALDVVKGVLPVKEFRRRTADGREFPVIISPGEITLAVVDYRPVYIDGDVAKPGQLPFVAGLTVRKAVALAGGYDILRFKMDNPFLQLSDLTSEYNTLWIAYAKQQAQVARLQAELDGKPTLDGKLIANMPIAGTLASDIVVNERNQLGAHVDDVAKEKAYLKRAVAKEGDRGVLLSKQQEAEKAGVEADTLDVQRYTDAYGKGSVILPRLTDARRNLLLSSTRALETSSLLASVERQQQDLRRRLERIDDLNRIQNLTDLQNATTQLASTRARLRSVSEKLRYTGMVKSQLVRGGKSSPDVEIVRVVDGRPTKTQAGTDMLLEPGDVVQIALQVESGLGVPK